MNKNLVVGAYIGISVFSMWLVIALIYTFVLWVCSICNIPTEHKSISLLWPLSLLLTSVLIIVINDKKTPVANE